MLNGKLRGQGVLTWKNGEKYKGEFVNGQLHGQGVLTWTDGRKYEGEFLNGQLNGQGVFTSADGAEERGKWVNGQRVYEALIPAQYVCEYGQPVIPSNASQFSSCSNKDINANNPQDNERYQYPQNNRVIQR